MESVQGGNWDCGASAFGFALVMAGLFLATPMTGGAATIWMLSYAYSGFYVMKDCFPV